MELRMLISGELASGLPSTKSNDLHRKDATTLRALGELTNPLITFANENPLQSLIFVCIYDCSTINRNRSLIALRPLRLRAFAVKLFETTIEEFEIFDLKEPTD